MFVLTVNKIHLHQQTEFQFTLYNSLLKYSIFVLVNSRTSISLLTSLVLHIKICYNEYWQMVTYISDYNI